MACLFCKGGPRQEENSRNHIYKSLSESLYKGPLVYLHVDRIPPVVDVESGRREHDDDDEEDGHDDGGLARLSEGEDAPDLVLAVRARVVGVAGAPHVLRLDAHAAVLALADQRLRLRTALCCREERVGVTSVTICSFYLACVK